MIGGRRQPNERPIRYSLHGGLPASYLADGFTDGVVGSFDQAMVDIHAIVDDLDSYFDPQLAPVDFLELLGQWFGVELNRRWPVRRRRHFVRQAVATYRLRGTAKGIAMAVELYTGFSPTVIDNGAVSASTEPLGPMPGSRTKELVVEVTAPDDGTVDVDLIDRIVEEVKPPHVPHEVRVRRSS